MNFISNALNEFMRGKEITYEGEGAVDALPLADPSSSPPDAQPSAQRQPQTTPWTDYGPQYGRGAPLARQPQTEPWGGPAQTEWGAHGRAPVVDQRGVSPRRPDGFPPQTGYVPQTGGSGYQNEAAGGYQHSPYNQPGQVTVQLTKPLGMILESRPCGTGAYVQELVEGSAASGLVQVGDVILGVAGRDVLSYSLEDVADAIKAAPPSVMLTLQRQHSLPSAEQGRSVVTLPSLDGSRGSHSADGGVFTLTKPLGVTLEDTGRGGVVIVEILAGLAAQRSGLIQLGDMLTSVNGVDVSTCDLEAVLDLIGRSPPTVTLAVQRGSQMGIDGCPARSPRGGHTPPRTHASEGGGVAAPGGGQMFTLHVTKPLGTVLEDKEGGGVFVESLTPGGSAQASGIQAGDALVRVGGHDVSSMDLDSVMEHISAASSPFMLTLCRPSRGSFVAPPNAGVARHGGHLSTSRSGVTPTRARHGADPNWGQPDPCSAPGYQTTSWPRYSAPQTRAMHPGSAVPTVPGPMAHVAPSWPRPVNMGWSR